MNLYPKVKDHLHLKITNVTIEIYRRKKQIIIPKWVFMLDGILKVLIEQSTPTISKIIEMIYLEGLNDNYIITQLPISESGFYREKRKIENKIFEVLILLGFVSIYEIINEKN